jgi:acetyl esterase/lipase
MLKIYLALLFCAAFVSAAPYFNATTYVYKTVGDLQIELDVYIPPNTTPPQSGYPVFFAIHGGAYIFGNKKAAFTDQEFNETMDRGWAIVSIDYRLVPGVVFDDMMADMQDAWDFTRRNLSTIIPINPDLMTVFGQSAGGGLVVICGYKLIPRPVAVVSFYPAWTNFTVFKQKEVSKLLVADAKRLRTPVYANYPEKGLKEPRNVLFLAAMGDHQLPWLMSSMDPKFPLDQIAAKMVEYSATENVDAKYSATYLAHGTKDRAVNFTQSVQLSDQLEKYNVPHVLDLVPGADHIFDYNTTFWKDHVLPAFDFVQKFMGTPARNTVKLNYE